MAKIVKIYAREILDSRANPTIETAVYLAMAKIVKIYAREILDSRANPTIETTVYLDSGHQGKCSIPSGASSSKYEACELRDNDPNRFAGMGVLKAVNHVNQIIAPKVIGLDPSCQTKLDQLLINLDATPNKSNLGANALLSISIAALKAGAAYYCPIKVI